jgi:hypothetical protein
MSGSTPPISNTSSGSFPSSNSNTVSLNGPSGPFDLASPLNKLQALRSKLITQFSQLHQEGKTLSIQQILIQKGFLENNTTPTTLRPVLKYLVLAGVLEVLKESKEGNQTVENTPSDLTSMTTQDLDNKIESLQERVQTAFLRFQPTAPTPLPPIPASPPPFLLPLSSSPPTSSFSSTAPVSEAPIDFTTIQSSLSSEPQPPSKFQRLRALTESVKKKTGTMTTAFKEQMKHLTSSSDSSPEFSPSSSPKTESPFLITRFRSQSQSDGPDSMVASSPSKSSIMSTPFSYTSSTSSYTTPSKNEGGSSSPKRPSPTEMKAKLFVHVSPTTKDQEIEDAYTYAIGFLSDTFKADYNYVKATQSFTGPQLFAFEVLFNTAKDQILEKVKKDLYQTPDGLRNRRPLLKLFALSYLYHAYESSLDFYKNLEDPLQKAARTIFNFHDLFNTHLKEISAIKSPNFENAGKLVREKELTVAFELYRQQKGNGWVKLAKFTSLHPDYIDRGTGTRPLATAHALDAIPPAQELPLWFKMWVSND